MVCRAFVEREKSVKNEVMRWFSLRASLARFRGHRLGTRDAVASLEDITAKGPLTLKNVIVLGNPFRFTKDNIDQFDF